MPDWLSLAIYNQFESNPYIFDSHLFHISTEMWFILSLSNLLGLFFSVLHTSKQWVQDQHETRSPGPQEHDIHLHCHSSWTDRCPTAPAPWWQWQQEWLLETGWLLWDTASWKLWEEWWHAAAPTRWVTIYLFSLEHMTSLSFSK